MGNTCEIALVLKFDDHKRLRETVDALNDNGDYRDLKTFLENPRVKAFNASGNMYCLSRSDGVKWDEDSAGVTLLRSFLDGHCHAFARIGEYVEDAEYSVMTEDDYGSEDDTFQDLLGVETKIIEAPGLLKLKKRKRKPSPVNVTMTVSSVGAEKEIYVSGSGGEFVKADNDSVFTLVPGKAMIKAVNLFKGCGEKETENLWWIFDADKRVYIKAGNGGDCILSIPEDAAGSFTLSFGDDGVFDDLCTIEINGRTHPWEFSCNI